MKKMNKIKKPWGWEVILCNNSLYCGKILHINRGYMSSLHKHFVKDETYYVTKGKLLVKRESKEDIVKVGEAIRIKPGVIHRFIGVEESEFIEISTEFSDKDAERYEMGGKISN